MDLISLREIKFSFLENYPKGVNSQPNYEWDVLRDSIKINGWNPQHFGYITISKDRYCINGHHRVVLLKEMYGDDFVVNVKRIDRNYWSILIKNIIKDFFKLRFKKKKWYKK